MKLFEPVEGKDPLDGFFCILNRIHFHDVAAVPRARLAIAPVVSSLRLGALPLAGIANLQEKKSFVISTGQMEVRAKTRGL